MRPLLNQQAVPASAPQQLTPEMQQLLGQLKDIHEPAAIGWWPLAPGWWIAFAALLGLLFAIALLLLRVRRHRRDNLYRSEGIRLLKAVDTQAPRAVEEINLLLKRVAVVTFGRRRCGPLTGNRWIEFLQQSADLPMMDAAKRTLLDNLYTTAMPAKADVATLRNYAIEWVRTHRMEHLPEQQQALQEASDV